MVIDRYTHTGKRAFDKSRVHLADPDSDAPATDSE
jgi:hypothetical protein